MAIGECGLDFDLVHYSNKADQRAVFPFHFDLAEKFELPMYFHSRNCETEFLSVVRENRKRFPTGVVHCFTGSQAELKVLVELGLYIGNSGFGNKQASTETR